MFAWVELGKSKRKPSSRNRPELAAPIGPDIIAVIEEFAEASVGMSRRYVNIAESPIAHAYEKGKLHGGLSGIEADKSAKARLIAGEFFRVVFEASQAPGHTKFEQSISTGPRTSLPDRQIDAGRYLARVKGLLGERDFKIVEAFCGHRYSMIDALRLANVPFAPQGVVPRVCEALDCLAAAVNGSRH